MTRNATLRVTEKRIHPGLILTIDLEFAMILTNQLFDILFYLYQPHYWFWSKKEYSYVFLLFAAMGLPLIMMQGITTTYLDSNNVQTPNET
jgi:hypothetical protein